MRRKILLAAAAAPFVLAAVAAILMFANPAPAVPDAGAASTPDGRPIVVKLHARWCPVCMTTKDVWSSVAGEYAGRVRFVVFDFTSDATTASSRARAQAAGLESLFDDCNGETGTVLVLDGRSREVIARLHGDREIGHYREVVDALLKPGA